MTEVRRPGAERPGVFSFLRSPYEQQGRSGADGVQGGSYHAMPMRPIPVHPRGPRRASAARPVRHVFGCPRISPEWELGAFHALIKPRPERAGFIQRTEPRQRWDARATTAALDVLRIAAERLGYEPALHFAPPGDFHFIAEVRDVDVPLARAMAIMLSKRMPGTWFVVGRIFVKDGRFFRRERGYKLNLVEATNVHLPREVRGALRGVI